MAKHKSKPSPAPSAPASVAATTDHGGPVRAWASIPHLDQIAILHELVLKQSEILRKEFPEIRGVGFGKRTKGPPSARCVHDESCLSILIEKKWNRKEPPAGHTSKALPKVLWASHGNGSDQRCCAVPVDVEELSSYTNVKLHNSAVQAQSLLENTYVNGVICCAVSWPAKPGAIFLLCCHHVFCMSDSFSTIPPDVEVFNLYTEVNIGHRPQFFGFTDSEGYFLDAALVELLDPSLEPSLITSPVINAMYASNINELAHSVVIQTNTQNVPASFVKAWYGTTDLLQYPWPNTTHKWVIEMEFQDPNQVTWPGDSGSPVFNVQRTIWQGMHIAGDNTRAYMLPAFELIRAAHYGISTDEELLTPI